MGKQFQIYLLPSDAANLVEKLRATQGLILLSRDSDSPTPAVVESPLVTQGGFTRADCLMIPDFSVRIHIQRTKQGRWSVDTLVSELIEFNACYYDQKAIKQGRLYYTEGFYNDQGAWQQKSARFLHWAQAIFGDAKKALTRDASLKAYVGEDALRWQKESGGVFISFAAKGSPPIIARQ